MKKKILKIAAYTTGIVALLFVVLCIHIYLVMRPKADARSMVMARIDIKQPITQDDAGKITAWLYQQKGVDHVVCFPKMDDVVFTYSPLKVDGNVIAANFRNSLGYANATRFIPSEKDLQVSCPVMAGSFSYKLYKILHHYL